MADKAEIDPDLARLEADLAALEEKRAALLAQIQGKTVTGGKVAVGGDVHGDVHLGSVDSGRTSPDALRRAYLHRVVERAGHLSLAGVDPSVAGRDAEARLSLDAVYTALLTRSPREQDDPLRRPAGAGKTGNERPLSALEQLGRHQRLVLLGDPGSGKSTFVNFAAMCLAGEALGSKEVHLGRLRAPLPQEDGQDEEESQPWDFGALLPVRVVLRDFAARALPDGPGRARANDLWNFLEAELEECGLGEYSAQLRKTLLEEGGLLLLDGLDEVPEAHERRQAIRRVVESFVEGFPNCRVLLTSRTYAYQNQDWRLPGFAEAVLAPFGVGQVRRFVDRWYSHAAHLNRLDSEEARGRAELLKRAIFSSDRLRFLAQRPLLLTLMASLHAWRGGSLPERRERLYADTVELLLDFWESQRVSRDDQGEPILLQPSLAEWLRVDREKVRQAIEELAFDAHASQGDLVGTADLAEGDVVGRLMRLRNGPEENPAQLVDYLSQRAGLLEPRGVGVYTFPHRTFQEYLAACHLTGGGFAEEEVADLAREDPNRWREVVLLASAKTARGNPSGVWHLVRALCFRGPDDEKCKAADEWGAHLAAQALTESADLTQVSERHAPDLERVRRWLVRLLRSEELPALERALVGKNLARLGDPRFDPDHWYRPRDPALGFVEVDEGSFLMGSDKSDAMAVDDEKPRHRLELPTFYMARFPVTVRQFRVFVEESRIEHGADSFMASENQPVVLVSWYEALEYCRWLTKHLKRWARSRLSEGSVPEDSSLYRMCHGLARGELVATLPSEAEWEKSARGTDGRIYPWGDEIDAERANYVDTEIGEPSSVGCFSATASPYGCEEMAGSVWEWTRSLWGKDLFDAEYKYPYNVEDGREAIDAPEAIRRVVRGGSFAYAQDRVRAAYRYGPSPRARRGGVGFRVAVVPFTSGLWPSEL